MAWWDSLGLVTLTLNYNITIVGKIWITVMVLLRLLVIIVVGYPLYQDEHARFVCNTMQPGCSNICFDAFSPVSHFRFWFLQAMALCLPLAMFVVYVAHKVTSQIARESVHQFPENLPKVSVIGREQAPCGSAYLIRNSSESGLRLYQSRDERNQVNEDFRMRQNIPHFCEAYILQLLVRMLLEAGFGVGQYYLFGFFVPNIFICYRHPCSSNIDCYTSRPTEKTLMLHFMLGAAGFSLVLNFVELLHVIKRASSQNRKNKSLTQNICRREPYCVLPNRAHVFPGHKVVQEYGAQARRRRGSGVSVDSDLSAKSQQREGTSLHSGVQSEHIALPNANSNNTHLTAVPSSSRSTEDYTEEEGSEVVLYAGEQRAVARGFSGHSSGDNPVIPTDQQGFRSRQLPLQRPMEPLSVSKQLIEEYKFVHLQSKDLQTFLGTGGRMKKSEWV
ncbi:gap junction gamma-1 protein [Callorhinchus milii]|uniref:gap junction gamma-1 protein n=1 Tax=Callorhinchus milii TaxID=7868 RepID=UPI00045727A6|nr:gap junction gamma-1 protein [Callorhinchus milii]|eukprot:gi/632952120/ref/XP_007891674.1/ PREDICTED: gap junction delta-4 protein [Callorhinchus milii]